MRRLRGLVFAGAAALILAACGGDSSALGEDESTSEDTSEALGFVSTDAGSYDEPETVREDFDEDAARERAKGEVSSTGYTGSCTQDCSGHDAGFAYAADGNDDGGLSSSQSFDEGQEAFDQQVEDRVHEQRQEYEGGGEQEY